MRATKHARHTRTRIKSVARPLTRLLPASLPAFENRCAAKTAGASVSREACCLELLPLLEPAGPRLVCRGEGARKRGCVWVRSGWRGCQGAKRRKVKRACLPIQHPKPTTIAQTNNPSFCSSLPQPHPMPTHFATGMMDFPTQHNAAPPLPATAVAPHATACCLCGTRLVKCNVA